MFFHSPAPRLALILLALGGTGYSTDVALAAQDFYLARDGQPAATIVTAAEPTTAAAFAAGELQGHVERITGARLPIVSDLSKVKGSRVLVGASKATEQLGLPVKSFAPQEYVIQCLPESDTLVLLGRDKPEPAQGNVGVVGRPEDIKGKHARAIALNGTDTGLRVQRSGFRDEQGSLEAWVWLPEETPIGEATLFRLDGHDPWTYHIVRQQAGARRIQYVTYYGPGADSVVSKPLEPGWHHVLATHTLDGGGRIELFIDGQSQGRDGYRKTTCGESPLCIGALTRSGRDDVSNTFRGRIDDVRVSDVVRAPDASGWIGPCKVDDHTTLLLPLDETDGSPQDTAGVVSYRPPPPHWSDGQATSYAVHDFLERCCDVRWYGPTELETVLPRTDTLAVEPIDVRRAPAMRFRGGGPRKPFWKMGDVLWNNPSQAEVALFWARLRLGGEAYAASHAFYTYYDRFWAKNPKRPDLFEAAHPDWFAKGTAPRGQRPRQMCFSNEEFIAQVVRDARAYFDGTRPSGTSGAVGDYFSVGPQDGSARCQCPQCQAQMNQKYKDHPHFTHGQYSDYIFRFVNKVARELKKTHPDKYVSIFPYSDYAYYPETIDVEPNVAGQLCLHVRNWWAPGMKRNDMKFYRQWVERHDGPLYVRGYYCFPQLWTARSDQWRCFPGFYAHTIAPQIKRFCRDGIKGVYFDGRPEQVDFYVVARLMDDPTLEVDRLLDEFFTRYYGAAAEPMRRLYLRIEEIFSEAANYPPEVRQVDKHWHQDEEMAWKWLGKPERMTELGRLMEQARQAAETDVEKQRVALFDQAVWQYMVEGRRRWEEKGK